MDWKRISWQVAGLTLLGVGSAFAATSGWPVDQGLNSVGQFVSRDIGFGMLLGGVAGWASHVLADHNLGKLSEHAGKFVIGGAALNQAPAIAGLTGMSPGAMIGHGHDVYATSLVILCTTNLLILGSLTVAVRSLRKRYGQKVADWYRATI